MCVIHIVAEIQPESFEKKRDCVACFELLLLIANCEYGNFNLYLLQM